MSWRLVAAIAVGGSTGALMRAGILDLFASWWSVALLAVNVSGSFALGLAVTMLIERPTVRAGFGTGFCGGFTSMSTFAVDVASRLHDGDVLAALILVVATVVGATTGALAGLRLGIRR
ncbi:MAG: camphor resistance protein CrcB [Acidimicrobiales bacterium]|nr:camphor resistance protein CrcB [Acidimicrobiales bacterium]